MDNRQVDGNRVARITPDGKITEFRDSHRHRLPHQHPRSARPQYLVYQGAKVGRVTPDGVITEFDMPAPNAGATGLTAGSDRCPPKRLTTGYGSPRAARTRSRI